MKLTTTKKEMVPEVNPPIPQVEESMGPSPLEVILSVTQTLISKVEGLSNIKDKDKIIGKLKGALELLSSNN